jgi:RHS repeat-associated protein
MNHPNPISTTSKPIYPFGMHMPGKTAYSLSIEQEEVLSKMVKYTQNISYSFGMMMPGRSFSSGSYRYGFNGKESDDEVSGSGNQYDYGFRIYNPRIGKFLSVDPLTGSYPWYTPYQFASNNPIVNIDIDGLEGKQSIENSIVEITKTALRMAAKYSGEYMFRDEQYSSPFETEENEIKTDNFISIDINLISYNENYET